MQNIVFVDAIARGYRLCRLKRAAPHEYRDPVEQPPLGSAQQVVTPAQRSAHRLLSQWRRAAARGQQLEGIAKSCSDLSHREYPCPGCGQLYSQRYSVQLPTDTCHSLDVSGG